MKKQRLLSLGFVALIVIVGFGCAADPAADKPDAEVSEALPETAVTGEGVALPFNSESSISWIGSKVTGSHHGGFQEFEGTVNLVDGDPTASSVSVTIDADSLSSDTEKLTAHLKSPAFFDVATYPTITFESTSIETAEDGFMITGNLNLHGVSKSIRFPAEISVMGTAVKVHASFAIKRFDFELRYPGHADDLIRDEVAITFDLSAGESPEEAEAETSH